MDAKLFRVWLHQVGELSKRQLEQLKSRLAGGEAVDDARDWINRRAQENLSCPHCQAAHVQRWGHDSGIQRYRCGDCHRIFNALTGSPLAGLKCREAWAAYTRAMIDGCTLRTAAHRSGVHLSTAFRWRHRLLQRPAQAQDTELHNIVEADETYFLESFKGRRQLTRAARHRGGAAAKRGLSAEQIPVWSSRIGRGIISMRCFPRWIYRRSVASWPRCWHRMPCCAAMGLASTEPRLSVTT